METNNWCFSSLVMTRTSALPGKLTLENHKGESAFAAPRASPEGGGSALPLHSHMAGRTPAVTYFFLRGVKTAFRAFAGVLTATCQIVVGQAPFRRIH